jgi:hypothetical protein
MCNIQFKPVHHTVQYSYITHSITCLTYFRSVPNYSPIYVWVSPIASFPQVSPPTPCSPLSPPPCATCPAQLIFLHLTTRTILHKEYTPTNHTDGKVTTRRCLSSCLISHRLLHLAIDSKPHKTKLLHLK